MKFLYLSVFFLAFHIITWCNNPKETQFVTEPFSFEAKGHLKLEGTLIIPENFTEKTKVAILVAPPMAMDKDYGGMFVSLAERLGKHGIATFRFNNFIKIRFSRAAFHQRMDKPRAHVQARLFFFV